MGVVTLEEEGGGGGRAGDAVVLAAAHPVLSGGVRCRSNELGLAS